MYANEMFESTSRSAGDLAGVFEYDGETAYFYLYNAKNDSNFKILGAILVLSGAPDFDESKIRIAWDRSETKVALYISEKAWAVFDSKTRNQYGGNYLKGTNPDIPQDILNFFEK